MQIEHSNYLYIDEFPMMKSKLNAERFSVWDELFSIDVNDEWQWKLYGNNQYYHDTSNVRYYNPINEVQSKN